MFSLFPFQPENLASRDGSGHPVPRQPAHSSRAGWIIDLVGSGWIWLDLVGSGPYLRAPRAGLVLRPCFATASIYLFKSPYAIGPVPRLSGLAIAYRWRSLPRVRWHRTSKPQGSSKRVLPW